MNFIFGLIIIIIPQLLAIFVLAGVATTVVISLKGALNWKIKLWVVPVVKPVPAVFVAVVEGAFVTLETKGIESV